MTREQSHEIIVLEYRFGFQVPLLKVSQQLRPVLGIVVKEFDELAYSFTFRVILLVNPLRLINTLRYGK